MVMTPELEATTGRRGQQGGGRAEAQATSRTRPQSAEEPGCGPPRSWWEALVVGT